MPLISRRPLTALFLLATACVVIVAWTTGNYEAPWLEPIMIGQLLILGGWAVLGGSHRLLRAGVFIAVVLALALPDIAAQRRNIGVIGFVLAAMLIIAGATAVFTAAWRMLPWVFRRTATGESPRWQVSLVELLGWMIVVALAATTLRATDFNLLGDAGWGYERTVIVLLMAAIAGLFMALGLPADKPCARAGGWYLALATAIGGIAASAAKLDAADAWKLAIAYAYVLAWIAVQRMDAGLSAGPPAGLPGDSPAGVPGDSPNDAAPELKILAEGQ